MLKYFLCFIFLGVKLDAQSKSIAFTNEFAKQSLEGSDQVEPGAKIPIDINTATFYLKNVGVNNVIVFIFC